VIAGSLKEEIPTKGWIPLVVLTFGMFLYVTEIGCYIKIFHYLYVYNNGISFLPRETKQKRNKTNAQMMMAQFYIFIADTLFAVFIFVSFLPGISLVPHRLMGLGTFLKTLDFGLVSFIHCLLIPELRQTIIESVLKLCIQFKTVLRYFKCKQMYLKHSSPRVCPSLKAQ